MFQYDNAFDDNNIKMMIIKMMVVKETWSGVCRMTARRPMMPTEVQVTTRPSRHSNNEDAAGGKGEPTSVCESRLASLG